MELPTELWENILIRQDTLQDLFHSAAITQTTRYLVRDDSGFFNRWEERMMKKNQKQFLDKEDWEVLEEQNNIIRRSFLYAFARKSPINGPDFVLRFGHRGFLLDMVIEEETTPAEDFVRKMIPDIHFDIDPDTNMLTVDLDDSYEIRLGLLVMCFLHAYPQPEFPLESTKSFILLHAFALYDKFQVKTANNDSVITISPGDGAWQSLQVHASMNVFIPFLSKFRLAQIMDQDESHFLAQIRFNRIDSLFNFLLEQMQLFDYKLMCSQCNQQVARYSCKSCNSAYCQTCK